MIPEGEGEGEHDQAWDLEVTCDLDPVKVAEARKEEVAYMKKRGLWDVVPRPEGVIPVSVRWVDVIKAEGITRCSGCPGFPWHGPAP